MSEIASIGGGIAGGLGLGNNDAKQSTTSSTSPWSPQVPYITQGLSDAANVYQQRQQSGAYQGNYYAPQNSVQTGAINQASGYTGGMGNTLAQSTGSTANNLLGAGSSYMTNAQNLFGQSYTPNSTMMNTLSGIAQNGAGQQMSSGLSGSLNSAATNAANATGTYQGNLQAAATKGLANNTAQTISDAGDYANSSYVQSAIDANNAAIDKTLTESTVPGLNRAASAGGNLNSSRAGMAETQANYDAALLKSQNAATLQNNAYNTGVNASTTQLLGGLSAANSASSSGLTGSTSLATNTGALQQNASQYNTTAQQNAANSYLSNGLSAQNLNNSTALSANSQLGNAYSLGLNGATTSSNIAGQNYNTGIAAGNAQQTADTQSLANDYQKWYMNNTYGQNILNDYMNVVGQRYGQDTTSNTSQTAASNSIASGLGTASSIYGLLGGSSGSSSGSSLLSGLGSLFGSGSTALGSASSGAASSGFTDSLMNMGNMGSGILSAA